MRRAIEGLRRHGAANATLLAVARGLAVVSGGRADLVKYYFLAQPVASARIDAAAHSGRLQVGELCADDPRAKRLPRDAAEIAQRFAGGGRCIAVWHGDELAGFLWFTDTQYREGAVRTVFRLRPADRAVWDFDVHVEPRFRLGRAFALLWDHAFAAMRARGARWSVSRVSAFNPESLRAHQRLGAVRTGWAVFVRFGALQFTLASLGKIKCRLLKHGPYLCLEVPAPKHAIDDERAVVSGSCGSPTA